MDSLCAQAGASWSGVTPDAHMVLEDIGVWAYLKSWSGQLLQHILLVNERWRSQRLFATGH
jgi:hypothetical protein